MRPPSPKERLREQQKWDRILAREGLGVLGLNGHWTFPGASGKETRRKGFGFVSLEGTESGTFSDDPRAVMFRRFAQRAHDLPPNYRGRRFILAIAETGYEQKAADLCRVSRWRVRHAVQVFCRSHGFDFRRLFHDSPVIRDTRDHRHPPLPRARPGIRARQHAPHPGAKQRLRHRAAA